MGSKPVAAAPFGAASATTWGPPPPSSSPAPIVTIASPPASIAMPAMDPTIENREPLDRRWRDATTIATTMTETATISATAVAACGVIDSRTRENPYSTTPMIAKDPSGSRMGSKQPLPRLRMRVGRGGGLLVGHLVGHRVSSTRMSRSTSRYRDASHPSPRCSSRYHRKKIAVMNTHRIAPPTSFMIRPAMS